MFTLGNLKFVTGRFATLSLSTSAKRCAVDPLESRFVAKIFRKKMRKNRKEDVFTMFDTKVPGKSRTLPSVKPKFHPESPKLAQSERLLHETVSKILQTGELDISVTVTRVKLAFDFSQMNIFWEASGDPKTDKKTQNKLDLKSKILRHLIMNYDKSGYVPTITFVQDLSYTRERELEQHLKNLDTGQSDRVHEQTEESVEDIEDSVKTMASQNILGLPHNELMKKVLQSKRKFKSVIEEPLTYTGKLARTKREKYVKQYSKVLDGSGKKKKVEKLEGDLTHLIPAMLDTMEMEIELGELKEKYRSQKEKEGLEFFRKKQYNERIRKTMAEENEELEDKDEN